MRPLAAILLICTAFAPLSHASEGADDESVPAAPAADAPQTFAGKLIRSSDEDQRIELLELGSDSITITEKSADGQSPYLSAHIEGRMRQAGWNLTRGKEWLLQSGTPVTGFVTEVKIEGDRTPVRLNAFDEKGHYAEEDAVIEIPHEALEQWRTAMKARNPAPSKNSDEIEFHRNHFVVAVGYSFISYSESNVPIFTTGSIMPQLSYEFSILPQLGIGVDAFITTLPVLPEPSRTDVAPFFWGWDAVARFTFPARTRVRLTLTGGMYYKSMIVSGNAFGFADMVGPELYPTLSVAVTPRDELSAFGRFLPSMDGFSMADVATNHEIGFGAIYTHRWKNGMQMPITAEVSMISLQFGSVAVQNNTYTLSLGLGL